MMSEPAVVATIMTCDSNLIEFNEVVGDFGWNGHEYDEYDGYHINITHAILVRQETQLSLTNRATRLEVSQGHQTWYHSIC